MKLWENKISSENDCTDGFDQRTCQQYYLVTISEYRKGVILEKKQSGKCEKERTNTGVFFSRAATFNFS